MIMLPMFDAAPPIYKEEAIAIDGLNHAVYAITAGISYNALDAGSRHEKRFNRIEKILDIEKLAKKFKK